MLKINPEIFKAYDIRGVYGVDFDNNLAYLLGRAFVQLRKEELGNIEGRLQIGVAHDMRNSSPGLKESLFRGLTEAGADVIDLGLIATPTFYFAIGHYKYDGGLMISASHNPKEWNGFKMVRSKSVPISGDTGINKIKELVLINHFLPGEDIGVIKKNDQSLKDSLEHARSTIGEKKIKHFKIVVDTANGMASTYLSPLFRELDVNIITLNFSLNGNFPAHEADPLKEENLEQLKEAVISYEADLGITSDGDGDRLFFIDNSGKTIDQSIIRGLLSSLFLEDKPGAKIGYDVRPGKITRDLIVENGGVPIITKVGHSLIKEQMIKENIYFAGESSGHFYLNGPNGCFEYPEIIIIKLLQFFSSEDKSVSEIIQPYMKYYQSGEINRDVLDKEAVFARIRDTFNNAEISEIDGISVNYDDYWFNIRASNTESKMRLNVEAIDQDLLKYKIEEILALIY